MSVYAFADLHGNGLLWDQIKAFLKPEDRAYFLGDAIDRGPDGWRIMNEILADERITYIKGNHEDMLYQDIIRPNNYDVIAIHYQNGGTQTLRDLWDMSDEQRMELKKTIFYLPTYVVYKNNDGINIFLSHSGGTDIKDNHDLIWNRDIMAPVPAEYDLVVHGHTPIPLIIKSYPRYFKDADWADGAFWYQDDKKVCLDCGAVWTNQTVLLNLDTFDEEIFVVEDN